LVVRPLGGVEGLEVLRRALTLRLDPHTRLAEGKGPERALDLGQCGYGRGLPLDLLLGLGERDGRRWSARQSRVLPVAAVHAHPGDRRGLVAGAPAARPAASATARALVDAHVRTALGPHLDLDLLGRVRDVDVFRGVFVVLW